MSFDLILHYARIDGNDGVADIGILGGHIAAIAPDLSESGAAIEDLEGSCVLPGLVETRGQYFLLRAVESGW